MTDSEWKSGRGGARHGAGRPAGSTNRRGLNPPRTKFAFSLPAEEGAALQATAEAEGLTPYAWIVKTIRRALYGGDK